MNIFKKLSLYFLFRKNLRKNRDTLLREFNVKVDFANRLYTVVNVPDTLGEPYNMRKSDNDRIAESYIKDYIFKLSSYLDSIGLSELYGYYQPIKKLDKFSYLIVIGYKYLSSTKLSVLFWYLIFPSFLISVSYLTYLIFF